MEENVEFAAIITNFQSQDQMKMVEFMEKETLSERKKIEIILSIEQLIL